MTLTSTPRHSGADVRLLLDGEEVQLLAVWSLADVFVLLPLMHPLLWGPAGGGVPSRAALL
jgi:hypothetical protein